MEDRNKIKLYIQSDFASRSHLMGIIHIHLIIYFVELILLNQSCMGHL